MFKRTYGRWGLKDGEGKPKIVKVRSELINDSDTYEQQPLRKENI
jgi:hypothetical protein